MHIYVFYSYQDSGHAHNWQLFLFYFLLLLECAHSKLILIQKEEKGKGINDCVFSFTIRHCHYFQIHSWLTQGNNRSKKGQVYKDPWLHRKKLPSFCIWNWKVWSLEMESVTTEAFRSCLFNRVYNMDYSLLILSLTGTSQIMDPSCICAHQIQQTLCMDGPVMNVGHHWTNFLYLSAYFTVSTDFTHNSKVQR